VGGKKIIAFVLVIMRGVDMGMEADLLDSAGGRYKIESCS
jgi:hypothetical protein